MAEEAAAVERRALTSAEKSLLCALADPAASCPSTVLLEAVEPRLLFDAIDHHGIEAVALRKLKAAEPKPGGGFAQLVAEAAERQFVANAMSMALEARAKEILEAVSAARARAVIVKGPVFAKGLYRHESDRPFTDIDILTPSSDLAAIGGILRRSGYWQARRKFWDRSEINMEQKWFSNENDRILVELHTNLVHDAALRRRLSFGFADHELASEGDRYPRVAWFLTAVIHAAAGHKFHKLQLLVDVLQAFRILSQEDLDALDRILGQIPARLETAICLELVDDLFDVVDAKDALAEITRGSNLENRKKFVDAETVLNSYFDTAKRSKVRRHAFRLMQKVAPRR